MNPKMLGAWTTVVGVLFIGEVFSLTFLQQVVITAIVVGFVMMLGGEKNF